MLWKDHLPPDPTVVEFYTRSYAADMEYVVHYERCGRPRRWPVTELPSMTSFPEWSKLSTAAREELRGSEDYLTARTFGLLRFCTPLIVAEILARLGVPTSRASDLSVELWPNLGHEPPEVGDFLGMTIVEPDAVVRGSGFAMVVEAKFRGSALGQYTSQLGREWLLGSELSRRCGWQGVCLLSITADGAEPGVPQWDGQGVVTVSEQIASFVADMAKRGAPISAPLPVAADVAATVRWTSWAHLADVIEDVASGAKGPELVVLREILAALETLGCTRFTGFRDAGQRSLPQAPTKLLARGGAPNRFACPGLRMMPAVPAGSLLGRS